MAIKSGSDGLWRYTCVNVLHPMALEVQPALARADTDQLNQRTRFFSLYMLAPIMGTCHRQGVGLGFGDIDPLGRQFHVRHGFVGVGNDIDPGRRHTLFLAVLIEPEVAQLVFDTYCHVDLLFMGCVRLGFGDAGAFKATDWRSPLSILHQ
jgi:hypothetical protein